MFKIYLAGAMSGLSKVERNLWRQQIQKHFNNHNDVVVINPCDYYDFDLVKPDTTEKEIKEFDLYQVRTSNLIIVNLTHPNSIGTAMELQVANDLHIPIIAFGKPKETVHPWILETITKRCILLSELLQYIKHYYLTKEVI